jgi:hypothetical protein
MIFKNDDRVLITGNSEEHPSRHILVGKRGTVSEVYRNEVVVLVDQHGSWTIPLYDVSLVYKIIVYRTGGTVNFKWSQVLEIYRSDEEARGKRDEIHRMGYPTKLIEQGDSMPTTFDGN